MGDHAGILGAVVFYITVYNFFLTFAQVHLSDPSGSFFLLSKPARITPLRDSGCDAVRIRGDLRLQVDRVYISCQSFPERGGARLPSASDVESFLKVDYGRLHGGVVEAVYDLGSYPLENDL